MYIYIFVLAMRDIFCAAVLCGCFENAKEAQGCKHRVDTYQLARVAALPCGDGQFQQVDVQHTHIVCMIRRWLQVWENGAFDC